MITADQLRELLDYDPETGIFEWRASGRGRRLDRSAGRIGTQGYRVIFVDRNEQGAHRLAWLYVHGEWPAREVDHINGVRDDNRIANLRDVSHSENQHNRHGAPRNNTTGFVGVTYIPEKRKYVAGIKVGGRRRHLGLFKTPEEAHAAYLEAKKQHHPSWVPLQDNT